MTTQNNLVPEIQETTMQVPCGAYSIFDRETAADVTEFERAVYIVINEHSNWEYGESHGLSYQRLANLLNVKHRSQVVRAVKSLIAKGWLVVDRQRKRDGANIYRLTHHKCPPDKVPVDSDGRPKKCAVPFKDGSPTRLLADSTLDWRAMVQWIMSKINSDWITGVVEMTCREADRLLRFGMRTIIDNTKKLIEVGLLERLTAKNEASVFQLFPKPYPERKERKERKCKEKPLAFVKGWYYSYNKRWRLNRETEQVQCEGVDGGWQNSNMQELLNINPKIHVAFNKTLVYKRRAEKDQFEADYKAAVSDFT